MTGMGRKPLGAAGLAAALLVVGCHQGVPEGQVVARVNGDEITQTELNAEMAAAGVPADQRTKAMPAVLQRVIERKLLAQAADKSGLNKDPEYVVQRQRADELLLAQRYVQQMTQKLQPPTSDQIDEYLRAHPAIAQDRQLLTLDQVRFPTPTDAKEVQALQGAETMDQLIDVLHARNVQFRRDMVRADTATLPDSLLASIDKLKPGEPVVIIGGPALTAAVVTARQPIPTSSEQATAIAKRRMAIESMDNRLKQENAALRQAAKVDYAKGMAPPATTGTPARQP